MQIKGYGKMQVYQVSVLRGRKGVYNDKNITTFDHEGSHGSKDDKLEEGDEKQSDGATESKKPVGMVNLAAGKD